MVLFYHLPAKAKNIALIVPHPIPGGAFPYSFVAFAHVIMSILKLTIPNTDSDIDVASSVWVHPFMQIDR